MLWPIVRWLTFCQERLQRNVALLWERLWIGASIDCGAMVPISEAKMGVG